MSAEKNYLDRPLREFLDDLAARKSAPGSGSLAALVGTLAAAQAEMVASVSIAHGVSGEQAAKVGEARKIFADARATFAHLIQEDMAVYKRYVGTRKSGDAEKTQEALHRAIAVPMEIAILAGAIVARLDETKPCVPKSIRAEMQSAASLAFSCAQAACTTVRANLAQVTDEKERERIDNRLLQLVGRTGRHRSAVMHYEPVAE